MNLIKEYRKGINDLYNNSISSNIIIDYIKNKRKYPIISEEIYRQIDDLIDKRNSAIQIAMKTGIKQISSIISPSTTDTEGRELALTEREINFKEKYNTNPEYKKTIDSILDGTIQDQDPIDVFNKIYELDLFYLAPNTYVFFGTLPCSKEELKNIIMPFLKKDIATSISEPKNSPDERS